MLTGMFASGSEEEMLENMLRNIDKLGLKNSAVYLFESPVVFTSGNPDVFPQNILLKCVMKSGELYFLPKERQSCLMSDIFSRNELALKCQSYVAFTLFYGNLVYGILLCELNDDIYQRGDYIALHLSKAFYLNELQNRIRHQES